MGRRSADKTSTNIIAEVVAVLTQWKQLVSVSVFTVGIAAGGSAWVGSYAATPKRVDKLEIRFDSGFKAINQRVDSGFKAVDSTVREFNETAVKAASERSDMNEKLDLLLRLNCPEVKQPTLVRSCRPYAPR